MYRPLSEAPIFVRPGTVIPMDGSERLANGGPLPEALRFRAFAGAGGGCHVIEDNGRQPNAPDRRMVQTQCVLDMGEGMTVTISPPRGATELVPEGRRYALELVGVENRNPDEANCDYEAGYDAGTRTLKLSFSAPAAEGVALAWHAAPACPALDREALLMEALKPLRMNNVDKDRVMHIARRVTSVAGRIAAWRCLDLPDAVMGLLVELEAQA